LGAEALGGGRLAGARTLALERLGAAGLTLDDVLDGADRAVPPDRLDVDGRTLGVVRRVGVVRTAGAPRLPVAGRAFGLGVRVGVERTLGGDPVRVLSFGGVPRVGAGAASLRGRARRVFEASPDRLLPPAFPASVRVPRETALGLGRFLSLSVTRSLGSSL